MGTRLRAFVILIGALMVVATFTYPLWRPEPVPVTANTAQFPELTEEQQAAFNNLPANIQRLYSEMRQVNAPMAVDLLVARLEPGDPILQEPPNLDTAVVAAQGNFGPLTLPEGDERELPAFSSLTTGSGSATLYQLADNRKLLRLENFRVTNGPNLRVVLSTLPDPVSAEELLADRFRIDIGPLQGSSGNQTYESVPTEINVDDYNSVVIYDATYNVIFSTARLL